MNRERVPLLFREANSDLSLLFATLCVVDIFGVFPIIALPRAIVQCGKSLPLSVSGTILSELEDSRNAGDDELCTFLLLFFIQTR